MSIEGIKKKYGITQNDTIFVIPHNAANNIQKMITDLNSNPVPQPRGPKDVEGNRRYFKVRDAVKLLEKAATLLREASKG